MEIQLQEEQHIMFKKFKFALGILCLGALVSCQGNAASNTDNLTDYTEYETESEETLMSTSSIEPGNDHRTVVGTDLNLLQAGLPEAGDTIVILHTNMGDVTIRMFPEEAPLAYENFTTHARNGFYDGVIFHRVIEDFMIQGGDPEGTGRGGESIWGHGFDNEFTRNLRHLRGALAMAHAGPNTLGSQFYIVHSDSIDPSFTGHFEALLEEQDELLGEMDGENFYMRDLYSPDMIEGYFRYGGVPFLDMAMGPWTGQPGHTVFGQVVAGMDVVDAIATTETGAGDRPVNDVIIESVTVKEYEG